MIKSAIVTGASGLLGSHIVKALRAKDVQVHAVVRDARASHDPGLVFHRVDFGQDFDVSNLPANVDSIFHVAQSREYRDFPEHAPSVFNVNTLSTSKLLDFARMKGIGSFVYASSGGIYEDSTLPLSEVDPIKSHHNLGHYLSTKLASESLVLSYSSLMNISVLRYFFIYGPDQHRMMMVPRIFDRVKGLQPIQIQGEEGLRFNPIHAADAAEATIMASIQNELKVSNIAGPEVISLKAMSTYFAQHLGVEPVYEYTQGTDVSIVADTSVMTRFYTPRKHLNDSFSDIEK